MTSWVRNKSDEAAADAGCVFDLRAADRVRYFFARFLRHSKGEFAGRKFELLDWQWERVIGPLFGWKMPDGSRRFRRAGIGIPKKNGKSSLLSGVGLYMLCGDNEPGAEVFSAAADRDQASIIFNEAANMVEASSALATHLEVKRSGKLIRYPRGRGFYKALSAEVKTKEGLNIHCLLFDELHAQKNWDLWNTLRYGGAARRQPLLLWISTAGVYGPEQLWQVEWNKARDVQEGRSIDISYLGVIYEAIEKDDWKSEETWKLANPSYGLTINTREFGEAVEEAVNNPAHENSFKRYRLNIASRQETRWIPMDRWDDCKRDFGEAEHLRKKCWVGVDLASVSDIVAVVLLFVVDGKKRILPYFWISRRALSRRKQENRTPMDHWVASGLITATDTEATDYNAVREFLTEAGRRFDIQEIAIDPWNATQVATDLEGDGFKVAYVRQGYGTISAAAKAFETDILNGRIEHPGNPVLDWMVSNVATETDAAGNIKPSKRHSREKIDGVSATLTAYARVIEAIKPKKSVYDKRGMHTC